MRLYHSATDKRLKITIFSGIIFVIGVILIIGSFISYNNLKSIEILKYGQQFYLTKAKLDKVLESILQKSRGIAASGERFYSQKHTFNNNTIETELEKYLTHTIKPLPYIYGAGLWYEPYSFDKNKKYFGSYSFRKLDSTIYASEYHASRYDYFNWDWYSTAIPPNWDRSKRRIQSAYLIKPYYDSVSSITMMTVSSIMYNDSSRIIGLATVDIDLNYIKAYTKQHSSANSNLFLVHSESSIIIYSSFNDSLSLKSANAVEYLKYIQDAPTDSLKKLNNIEINGKLSTIYYTKLESGIIVANILNYDVFNNQIYTTIFWGIILVSAFSLIIATILGSQIFKITRSLHEKNQQFTYFMNNLPAMAYLKNSNSELIFANDYTKNIFGIPTDTTDEISLKTLDLLVNKFESSTKSQNYNSQIHYSFKLEDANNNVIIFDTRQFSFPLNESNYLQGYIALDVTEQEEIKKVETCILHISQYASKAQNLQELYKHIHSEISELMYAKNFFIGITDTESQSISFPYVVDEIDTDTTPIPIAKTLCKIVIDTSSALLIDKKQILQYVAEGIIEQNGEIPETWLGVPLTINNAQSGVMVIQSYSEKYSYTEKHKNILNFVAEQIDLFITKIQAEETLTNTNIELEKRVQKRTAELKDANEELLTIIEQKAQNEKMLKLSEIRFKTVANSAPVMIWMTNLEGRITFVNNEIIKFIDSKYDLINDGQWYEAIDTDIRLKAKEKFYQHLADKSEFRMEVRIKNANNDYRWIAIYGIPLSLDNTYFEGFIGSGIDITDMKIQNEAINEALRRQQELNEMKSRFISTVSHEYKTPLTSILTSAYLIEQSAERNDVYNIQKFSKLIQQAVDNMNTLLEDVLAISRDEFSNTQKISLEPIDIDLLAKKLIDSFRTSNNDVDRILFVNHLKQNIFNTNLKSITIILNNLLSNALKYSSNDSPIELIYKPINETKSIRIIVRDYGIGIPEDDLKHLFEPFHRAGNTGKIKGTGLGLSIVKNEIQHLGGTINVFSSENKGTKFIVELPILTIEDSLPSEL